MPVRELRYDRASSLVTVSTTFPANFGGRAVHTTPETDFRSAQPLRPGKHSGEASPLLQTPTKELAFLGETPSRLARAARASDRSVPSNFAQSDVTNNASGLRTSVKRPSADWRWNSTRTSGPSVCQCPTIGSSRGSHISEPQPMNAITPSPSRTIKVGHRSAQRGRYTLLTSDWMCTQGSNLGLNVLVSGCDQVTYESNVLP